MKSRQKWYIAGGYIRTGNVYYDARDDYIIDREDWGITPANLLSALSEFTQYKLYDSLEAAKTAAYARARKSHTREDSDRNVFTVAEILVHPSHDQGLEKVAREKIIFVRANCYRLDHQQQFDSAYEADFFARKSYGSILNQHKDNNSVVEGIRFLFNDYAKPRLFTFHFNRHHKTAATHIVDWMPLDCAGAYDFLLNQLEELKAAGAKQDGSMMRRMQYALSKLGAELTNDLEVSSLRQRSS